MGNDGADLLAGNAQGTSHRNEPKGEEKFHLVINEVQICGRTRRGIAAQLYNKIIHKWYKTQPKQSWFDRGDADQRSLPNKNDSYANFSNKIMTGTIWTNKQKHRYNMRATAECSLCSTDTNQIIDSHEHALGECQIMIRKHNVLWKELKRRWKEAGADTITFKPWFTTSEQRRPGWSLAHRPG